MTNLKLIRRLFVLLLLTSLSVIGFAQESAPQLPNVERLRAHITYLASDKLDGRRTGSPGANLGAEYVAKEFARYGLRRSIGVDLPGMSILEADSPNRYLQKFPYVAAVELGKNNLFSVNPGPANDAAPFTVGEDWMPLGFSSNGDIQKAPFVFVGYGITDTELKYDSYGSTAKDKIAIAIAGTPDGDNPHGKFGRYEDVRWKAIAARTAGARALLVIAQEANFKEDRLAHLHYDNSAGEAGLPVAVISQSTAGKLFFAGDLKETLAALAKAAKTTPGELPATTVEASPPPSGRHFGKLLLLQKDATLSLSIAIARHEVPAANVIGILDGSDPQLKKEVIVIGAHYDHLGRGGEGSLAPREGEIHHGADDNASGVAGLLELARIFAAQQPRPRRTIVFMAFSGEEEGLLGSNFYVNNPILPLSNSVAMINMDMIGRMKDNKLIIGGVGTAPEWRKLIAAANSSERMNVTAGGMPGPALPSTGQPVSMKVPIVVAANGSTIATMEYAKPFELTLNEDGYGPSDHSSFYLKKIPVLFFFTGSHEDYHKPSDTADKINYADEARIVTMVARIVSDLDKNARPAYTVAKSDSNGRSMGFRVYLGTIPNYGEAKDGLLLDGVRDDSPASKAGLKAGDKIVRLAGRDVRNVYDYTYALGEMKAGQEYEVEAVRAGEHLKLKITPAARK
jgi:aminopeptidase YwaD